MAAKESEALQKAVQIINAGFPIEKMRKEECKAYLVHHGLRLVGSKSVLVDRIREHLNLQKRGGENVYPSLSFNISCKGLVCEGDLIKFEENSPEGVENSVSRRTIAARVVSVSDSGCKYTLEVVWSSGGKKLPYLYCFDYTYKKLQELDICRQQWLDEDRRKEVAHITSQKLQVLEGKVHSRSKRNSGETPYSCTQARQGLETQHSSLRNESPTESLGHSVDSGKEEHRGSLNLPASGDAASSKQTKKNKSKTKTVQMEQVSPTVIRESTKDVENIRAQGSICRGDGPPEREEDRYTRNVPVVHDFSAIASSYNRSKRRGLREPPQKEKLPGLDIHGNVELRAGEGLQEEVVGVEPHVGDKPEGKAEEGMAAVDLAPEAGQKKKKKRKHQKEAATAEKQEPAQTLDSDCDTQVQLSNVGCRKKSKKRKREQVVEDVLKDKDPEKEVLLQTEASVGKLEKPRKRLREKEVLRHVVPDGSAQERNIEEDSRHQISSKTGKGSEGCKRDGKLIMLTCITGAESSRRHDSDKHQRKRREKLTADNESSVKTVKERPETLSFPKQDPTTKGNHFEKRRQAVQTGALANTAKREQQQSLVKAGTNLQLYKQRRDWEKKWNTQLHIKCPCSRNGSHSCIKRLCYLCCSKQRNNCKVHLQRQK